MSNPPFIDPQRCDPGEPAPAGPPCDVCGSITLPVGENLKCLNCGNVMKNDVLSTRAVKLLERLYYVVSEQQHVLQSMGWQSNDNPNTPQWSSSGTLKHVYEDVEAACKDVTAFLEGKEQDYLFCRLLQIKDLAIRACALSHTHPCKCWCCQVIQAANGLLPHPESTGLKIKKLFDALYEISEDDRAHPEIRKMASDTIVECAD